MIEKKEGCIWRGKSFKSKIKRRGAKSKYLFQIRGRTLNLRGGKNNFFFKGGGQINIFIVKGYFKELKEFLQKLKKEKRKIC